MDYDWLIVISFQRVGRFSMKPCLYLSNSQNFFHLISADDHSGKFWLHRGDMPTTEGKTPEKSNDTKTRRQDDTLARRERVIKTRNVDGAKKKKT